jgi:hypothetical protein
MSNQRIVCRGRDEWRCQEVIQIVCVATRGPQMSVRRDRAPELNAGEALTDVNKILVLRFDACVAR